MPTFPLSPSKQVGNLLFISGQIGQQDGTLVSNDIVGQTEQAISNITKILEDHSMSLKDVVDVTVFLIDQDDYVSFNETYAKSFQEPYPTRTAVTVKSLPLGAKVELKAIASK